MLAEFIISWSHFVEGDEGWGALRSESSTLMTLKHHRCKTSFRKPIIKDVSTKFTPVDTLSWMPFVIRIAQWPQSGLSCRFRLTKTAPNWERVPLGVATTCTMTKWRILENLWLRHQSEFLPRSVPAKMSGSWPLADIHCQEMVDRSWISAAFSGGWGLIPIQP